MAYVPQNFNAVSADLKPSGSPAVAVPNYNAVNADLSIDPTGGSAGGAQTVLGSGFNALNVGNPSARLKNQHIALQDEGRDASEFGEVELRLSAARLWVDGIDSAEYGYPVTYNYRQYVEAYGEDMQAFGEAVLRGGVKFVEVVGLYAAEYGNPEVINTRGDQTAAPEGLEPAEVGGPFVSPQTVFAFGFIGLMGTPQVERNPSPLGFNTLAFGYPDVGYKTRQLRPAGLDAYGEGFPRVADRARKLYHAASALTTLFGDAALRNVTFRVSMQGVSFLEMSPWAEVRNTRRQVLPAGIAPQGVGPGTAARNKTPSLAPLGFDAQQFGRLDHLVVGWRIRELRPSGVPVPLSPIGVPVLWQTPSFGPDGIAPPLFPEPMVAPAIRALFQHGHESLTFGAVTLDFSYRHIVAEGEGIAAADYGEARIEHERRAVEILGDGFMAFGEAWVSPGIRALEPKGVEAPYLHLHRIGGTQHLGPEGFDALRWLTRITPESRELFPSPFFASYGWPTVQFFTRHLRVDSIRTYPEDAQRYGTASVHNLRQYIVLYEDQSSALWPLPWPLWTAVENRNKSVGVAGFNASRLTGPAVDNHARAILPTQIAAPVLPEYQKTGEVSYRVRALRLDGLAPPPVSHWAVVYNDARLIAPSGIAAELHGCSQVVNLRRSYRMQGFESAAMGYPFVAERIRELTFESRYGIAPPQVNLPVVDLWTRYIDPASITGYGVGHPSLDIFWRRITPRWTHSNSFGYAVLRNNTPEMLTRGRAADEYGDSFVRLEWRPILAEGSSTQLFGRARISDRKQQIIVSGNNYMIVSDKLTARRIGEDPVITQYIDLRVFIRTPDGEIIESSDGHGIGVPALQVGMPDLSKGYIFPSSVNINGDHLALGKPVVTANTIRVQPGYGELLVGEPFVSLKNRALVVGSLADTDIKLGKPRLSPHTIYAVLEAPDQALRNHKMNKESLSPVNSGIRIGSPNISTYLGVVKPHPIYPSGPSGTLGVGRPELISMRRVIEVKGVYVGRMGWVTIPSDKTILIEESIFSEAHGSHAVNRPPYIGPQTVKTSGITPPIIEINNIEHKNRTVKAASLFSQSMGASGLGSYTNMPQNLHVGFVFKNTVKGIYASGYSEPWISHKIRGLEVEGFESFASEYDYQNFQHRMRVRNIETNIKPRQDIIVAGMDGYSAGMPDFKPGLHFIRPDGNSDQHRKGAF